MRYQHANADVGVKDGEKPVEPEVCEPETNTDLLPYVQAADLKNFSVTSAQIQ